MKIFMLMKSFKKSKQSVILLSNNKIRQHNKYLFFLVKPLRQPGFKYSACGPFTKNKIKTQKLKEIKRLFGMT